MILQISTEMFNLDSSDIANKGYGSEYSQDLFALFVSNFKKHGFFVEIGMADGQRSNTYRLEKYFNWTGILIEAHPNNFNLMEKAIVKRNAILINKAVSNISNESALMGSGGTASLYNEYCNNPTEIYTVQVDTLDSILHYNRAPKKIDYISIDAEGSELDILSKFSFRYNTDFFSIEIKDEHLAQVAEIMKLNNYIRVLEPFSDIDSWYVKESIYDNLFKDWKK